MRSLRVYLIASVLDHTLIRNDRICGYLDKRIDIFKPQTITPEGDHRQFPRLVYDRCVSEIRRSDMGLLVVPYGRDCSWEVGYYSNSNKPVVAYVENETEWLQDWMIKGGLDFAVTPEQSTFKILRRDLMLFDKTILLDSVNELSDKLIKIHERGKHGEK